MKQRKHRITALVLALSIVFSMITVPAVTSAEASYGKTTASGVRIRKAASTEADYWFRVGQDTILTVLSESWEKGVHWYCVTAEDPEHPGVTRTGYVHGDFLIPVDASAQQAETVQMVEAQPQVTAVPDNTGSTAAGGEAAIAPAAAQPGAASDNMTAPEGTTGETTNSGVNFRESEGGPVIQKLDRGVTVELLTVPVTVDSNHWYMVRYNGRVGYIQAPFIRVTSSNPAATTVPLGTYGYVKLIKSSANLREQPLGDIKAQWVGMGQVLAVTGAPVAKGGYTWYPISYNNKSYVVRHDVISWTQEYPGAQPTAVPDAPATAVPTAVPTAEPTANVYGYVRTMIDKVNLRLKPAGEMVDQLAKNLLLPCLSAPEIKGGYTWYYVQYKNVKGYLRSDCVTYCDANGNPAVPPATPVPTAVPGTAYGYVKTTASSVNLRSKPAGDSKKQLDLGTVLTVTGVTVSSGRYVWYPVMTAAGETGYLRNDCVAVCNADGSAIGTPTQEPGATEVPGAPTPQPVSPYGYMQVTASNVNVRKTPGGDSIGRADRGTVYALTGNPVNKSNYVWYPITLNGKAGYVRGDCAFKLSPSQQESYLNGNGVPAETPAPVVVEVNYVQTTVSSVNLRISPSKDATSAHNVPTGTVMAYNSTKTVGGSTWFRVVYANSELWVLGSCVKVMTQAEYEAYLAGNPAATPQPEVLLGYVKTTASGVNLRATANGTNIIGRVDKGVVMSFSQVTSVRNVNWYYVKTASGGNGYIRGDCVQEVNADGSAIATPTPYEGGGGSGGTEAVYTTLKKGSSGSAVKNLVTELKNKGYYTGAITSTYTTAVETAVKAFQRARGLTVDGIAGPTTQHALFGTVPPSGGGAGNGGSDDLTMPIYPAEKIDWYTGGIQQLWPKGTNYKIYDVKTGIVWWAHRWSGGSHIDAEPLTAADTARLCRAYGVSSASEIETKNLWQRRPCLVTIGSRTFACSLYGVPHNYPEGDTIPSNNFRGQLCIHFTNSKTHGGNTVDTYHTEAIDYAWRNAPNGYK